MNSERKECTITWFIENYSLCWHKNGEVLSSPQFIVDGLEGTVWDLRLKPRGGRHHYKGYISLFLFRSEEDDGPEEFQQKYELSILTADGSAVKPVEMKRTFKRGNSYGLLKALELEELWRRQADFLPQDTFCVRCKLWKDEENILPVTEISVRTRIGMEQIAFLHIVEGFSALEPNQKQTVQIKSPAKNGLAFSSNLHISDGSCCEEKIIVAITPFESNHMLFTCKLSLVDGSGKKIKCGEIDNRLDTSGDNTQMLSLSFTRQDILNGKIEYLPGDKLSLLCECCFSTGVEYEKIDRTQFGIPFVALNHTNDNDQKKDTYDATEKLLRCASISGDLKAFFDNGLFTDVELKTKAKSFPAHKLVLCARSSVFQAMLTNDMRERNTHCIQIDDLEDDIVQKLLLFLYSDHLENMQWESAMNLYYAGDKYAIEKLKVMCASFLVNNLSTTNASELLLLADTHNDSQLKKAVEDFIFKHEEQVFGSDEWMNLIETNPVLVSKTMCLKYARKI